MKKLVLGVMLLLVMLGTVVYASEIGENFSASPHVERDLWIGSGANPNVYSGIRVRWNAPNGVAAISTRVNAGGNWSAWQTRGSRTSNVNLASDSWLWSPRMVANRNSLVIGNFEYVRNLSSQIRMWVSLPQMTFQLR